MMPYWVVVDRGLFGPYETESRAESMKDSSDDGYAEVYYTESYNEATAKQEIRHKRVKRYGSKELSRNFRRK